MKKKFLKYFIICTAIMMFMSSRAMAVTYEIPVWSSQNNKINTITSSNSVNNVSNIATTNEIINTSKNVISNVNSANTTNSSNILNTNSAISDNPLKLTCGSAILIEQNSGNVLYEYNMHEKLRPASVTKVMTILLIMEALDSGRILLTDKVSCSENASNMGGSQIWLDTREELTVDEMLKAICVVSANDCTVAMAEFLEGSEEAFVAKMNERAKELGMNDTTFMNCHGIDEDGHLTSSYDIAIMSRELLTKHKSITNYTTIYIDSLRDGKSELVNTNKLVRNYNGCTGLKTGSTSIALFNLSASATRNGISLIAVVMKSPTSNDRFNEAKKLLDYGFSNYQYVDLGKAGDVLESANVNKGLDPTVSAVLQNDIGIVMKKGKNNDISQNIEIYNNISAPITKGQKIGEVSFSSNNNEIVKADLVADKDIAKYSFLSMTSKIYKTWFTLIR